MSKTSCFQGFGEVGAAKVVSFEGPRTSVGDPWAPKRRPEAVRTGEVASDRAWRGGQDSESGHVRVDCLSELWKPAQTSGNQREPVKTKSSQRSKSMYIVSHVIRSVGECIFAQAYVFLQP